MKTQTVQTSERETRKKQLIKVFSRYQGRRGELIPILQDTQDAFGYIPREAMTETARFLNVPEAAVYGVVTFYAQFYLTRQGKHRIRVCQGTACHVLGSAEVQAAVEKKLGITSGETTEDHEFSLERVACFGSCALAPVMVVDEKVYGNVSPEQAVEILESYT